MPRAPSNVIQTSTMRYCARQGQRHELEPLPYDRIPHPRPQAGAANKLLVLLGQHKEPGFSEVRPPALVCFPLWMWEGLLWAGCPRPRLHLLFPVSRKGALLGLMRSRVLRPVLASTISGQQDPARVSQQALDLMWSQLTGCANQLQLLHAKGHTHWRSFKKNWASRPAR